MAIPQGRGEEAPEPAGKQSLWANRDYVLLWSGQTISVCGSVVSQLAFPLLILALTGSPAQAGLVGGLRMVPYLLLSLPAGALADRWDRKRAMIVCDLGRAAAMGSIPIALVLGHLMIVQLYLVSLVEGTLMVFFSLSSTAAVPRVVGRDQITAAMGYSDAAYQTGFTIGPVLGGLLYSVGRFVPFIVDAISYFASVVSLFFIKTDFQEERIAPSDSMRAEIGEGLRWLWNKELIRTMALLSAVAWIMLAPAYLTVIVLAHQQHASPSVIGLVSAAGGLGGVVGALTVSRLNKRLGFARMVIGAAWMWAFLWPLYAFAPNPVVLALITFGLFFTFPQYNVTQMSYRLQLIPDALQGRVNSVFRLLAFTGQPLGLWLGGALLQALGPRTAIMVLEIAPIGMAIASTMNRSIRNAPNRAVDLHASSLEPADSYV